MRAWGLQRSHSNPEKVAVFFFFPTAPPHPLRATAHGSCCTHGTHHASTSSAVQGRRCAPSPPCLQSRPPGPCRPCRLPPCSSVGACAASLGPWLLLHPSPAPHHTTPPGSNQTHTHITSNKRTRVGGEQCTRERERRGGGGPQGSWPASHLVFFSQGGMEFLGGGQFWAEFWA
jgi:hypothetical protein